jgi:hypothetical protein
MDAALAVAILAAAVTALGWFANHLLSAKAERRRMRAEASRAYVERQLEELYGPLAFLIIEGRRTFVDLLEGLGRNSVFVGGRALPDDELKTWLFWVEHDFFPRNQEMKRILMTKAHLIDGGEMPSSYIAFLDHHNSWRIHHLRWREEGVPYPWHSKVNWPEAFEEQVLDTFRELKAKHAELLGRERL